MIWAQTLISVSLVAALLWRVDLTEVGRALITAPVPLLALAAALFFLMHVLNAVKLRVLLPEQRVGRLLAHTLVAQFYALVLPGQLAGEAVKAYRLSRTEATAPAGAQDGGRVVSAVVFDKVTGIGGLLLVTLAGLALEMARFGGGLLLAVLGVLAGLAVAVAALAWKPTRTGLRSLLSWRAGPRRRAWLLGPLDRFLAAWQAQARQPARAALSVMGGVAVQVAAVAGSQALGLAVGIDQPFSVWSVVIGVMSVIVLLPVTVAGIGLREASLVGLLDPVGVPHSQSLGLGLGILAFQVMVALVGAVIDLVMPRLDRRRRVTADDSGS